MAQGKQAKVLTDRQLNAVLAAVESRRYPLRDRVMVLLSVRAGLRAKEISMVDGIFLQGVFVRKRQDHRP